MSFLPTHCLLRASGRKPATLLCIYQFKTTLSFHRVFSIFFSFLLIFGLGIS